MIVFLKGSFRILFCLLFISLACKQFDSRHEALFFIAESVTLKIKEIPGAFMCLSLCLPGFFGDLLVGIACTLEAKTSLSN